MTADARSLAERLYGEFWNAGDDTVADEIVSPAFVDHHVSPEIPRGPDGVREWAAIAKGGFPDFRIEILDIVDGGSKVACRIEFSGTHTGEFNGIPPTGNRTVAQAISLFRAEDGMLVEAWEFADVPAFLEPLGIVLGPTGD